MLAVSVAILRSEGKRLRKDVDGLGMKLRNSDKHNDNFHNAVRELFLLNEMTPEQREKSEKMLRVLHRGS